MMNDGMPNDERNPNDQMWLVVGAEKMLVSVGVSRRESLSILDAGVTHVQVCAKLVE